MFAQFVYSDQQQLARLIGVLSSTIIPRQVCWLISYLVLRSLVGRLVAALSQMSQMIVTNNIPDLCFFAEHLIRYRIQQ